MFASMHYCCSLSHTIYLNLLPQLQLQKFDKMYKLVADIMFSDSKSAVGMAFDPVAFKKTKHILRAAEFLRDLVHREAITLQHVAGVVMLADILTKAVSRPIFLRLLQLLDQYAVSGDACPS